MEGSMARLPGLFDLDERYAALSKSGDSLERLSSVVDFEMLLAELDKALARSERSKGGCPPFDAVLMFRVLIVQSLYGLADEQTEFQIRDRLSFMRFLGLDLHGRVPNARTIWLFREHLTRAGAVEALFARFDTHLKERGYLALIFGHEHLLLPKSGRLKKMSREKRHIYSAPFQA
jgi:transposase